MDRNPCYSFDKKSDERFVMSEFIKMAYEANRVKDVHDAVKEFPPEEEWHHGKIENIIRYYLKLV